jgi:internalin A
MSAKSTPRSPPPYLENESAVAEAERLIDEALETGATALSLERLRLRRLPEKLRLLGPQLQSLSLAGCRRLVDVAPLESLNGLTRLDLKNCVQLSDLSPLVGLSSLDSLNLDWCTQLNGLRPLEAMGSLNRLHIRGCDSLQDFSALAKLGNLQMLDLSNASEFIDLGFIAGLTKLHSLDISSWPFLVPLDLSALARLDSLRSLSITDLAWFSNFDALARKGELQSLEMSALHFFEYRDAMAGMSKLSRLKLSQCWQVDDFNSLPCLSNLDCLELTYREKLESLDGLLGLHNLRSLHLTDCGHLKDFHALTDLIGLQHLSLGQCYHLRDLSALSHQVNLQSLGLLGCQLLEDLSGLSALSNLRSLTVRGGGQVHDLTPLGHLGLLNELELAYCDKVDDLSAVGMLVNLIGLSLEGCIKISDISCLSGLERLQTLDLSYSFNVKNLSVLSGLPLLQRLSIDYLIYVDQLATMSFMQTSTQLTELSAIGVTLDLREVDGIAHKMPRLQELRADLICGAPRELGSNALAKDDCLLRLEQWCNDLLCSGSSACDRLKLFVLGNGRAGKTQIVRRLRGLAFDHTVDSTHGIQNSSFALLPEAVAGQALSAQVWDFGGQDIYLSTHSLFMDDRAIYLLVWTPSLENDDTVCDNGMEMRNRKLAEWLAYIHAMVGSQALVLVVQAQCDLESQRQEAPVPAEHGFGWLQRTACSAVASDGMERLWPELRAAARLLQERHGEVRLPNSWMAVTDTLREAKAGHQRLMTRADFNALCMANSVCAPDTTLAYLHQTGEVFSLANVFDGDVVLDQAWALDGLYALLQRQKVLPVLRQQRGHFTRELLAALIWDDAGYSEHEQGHFLSLMQRCGVCFEFGQGQYLAPDCLPGYSAVKERDQAVWRGADAACRLTLRFHFLHEGMMRTLISAIGQEAGVDAVYWRFGAAFYDAKLGGAVRIYCKVSRDAASVIFESTQTHGAGYLNDLAVKLHKKIGGGIEPDFTWERGEGWHVQGRSENTQFNDAVMLIHAQQPPLIQGELPVVHVSYSWGDDSEDFVELLEQELSGACVWRRDKRAMRSGEWISAFMDEIALSRCVVVVISDKYLRSPYCMRELLGLFQTSLGQKSRLMDRIVPVVLPDAQFHSTPQRMAWVKHWKQVFEANAASVEGLDDSEKGFEFVQEQQLITEFRTRVADVLKWVTDVLMPRPDMPQAGVASAEVARIVRQRISR